MRITSPAADIHANTLLDIARSMDATSSIKPLKRAAYAVTRSGYRIAIRRDGRDVVVHVGNTRNGSSVAWCDPLGVLEQRLLAGKTGVRKGERKAKP